MGWSELCFLHWPIDAALLRPLIPAALEIDSFQGQAWIALVPFQMEMFRRQFLEFNVRTYVRDREVGGVWFFSLDCTSPLAVRGARSFFHLPYFDAEMSKRWDQGWCDYSCRRGELTFRGRYGPDGDVFSAAPGSLEEWLTERYWLFSADSQGRVYRGRVHHRRWPLQSARIDLERWSMGFDLPGAPASALYCHNLWVTGEWLEPARGYSRPAERT